MEQDKKVLTKSIMIWIFLIIGILLTIDLAYIYYQANFNQFALPSFCSVSELIDCDGVAKTVESQFLGVPLAYWGLFLYSFIMMLMVSDKLKNIKIFKFLEVFKNKFHYIASLGLISFLISMTLLCISLFGIKKICVLCMATYILNLAIGLVAVQGLDGGFFGAIKQSFIDFKDALKPLPYKIAFVIVIVIASSFLSWTYVSAKFSPALRWKHEYGEFTKDKNQYAIKGNVLGSDASDAVVLHIYSDYMCPMCKACNVILHKLAKEYKNLRIEHHSMPLDMECNSYLTADFHRGSCLMAQYAEASYIQGKFWEVNTLFFEKHPYDEDEILKVLKDANFGLDMEKLKKDAHSPEVKAIIQENIKYAFENNNPGTPSMKLGHEFRMGVKGYHEMRKWVEKHGAKPKGLF